MICVLVVASGAAWEPEALELLAGHRDIVVLKRCVDVADLLAAATAGQADAAVVALDAPGLDVAAVEHLRRHQVRPLAIVPTTMGAALDAARERAERMGLQALINAEDLAGLPELVLAAEPDHPDEWRVGPGPIGEPEDAGESDPAGRRVIAVWGPSGAPGRTTLATTIAAILAERGERTVLVDADPWGASVAQHLGVLDESSGMLGAARLAFNQGLEAGFAGVQRALDEHLTVVTGLPRPDRWVEVRAGVVEQLVEVAGAVGHVVLDVGFCLEQEAVPGMSSRPGRNTMTLEALAAADEVVVVGSADPVGLARLARGLVELRELGLGTPLRVVVNRMRPGLGWAEKDIAGMVEGFARIDGLHFLPEDRAATDRALVAGQSLVEAGDSALAREVGLVVEALVPGRAPVPGRRRRLNWRRAGTVLRR